MQALQLLASTTVSSGTWPVKQGRGTDMTPVPHTGSHPTFNPHVSLNTLLSQKNTHKKPFAYQLRLTDTRGPSSP